MTMGPAHVVLALLVVSGCADGAGGDTLKSDDGELARALGAPLPGLTDSERALFDVGREDFVEEEEIEEGLGPIFNEVSCGGCHFTPAIGGGSETVVTRFGTSSASGGFDPLAELGGSLVQVAGIGPVAGAGGASCDYEGEVVPAEATIVTHRLTTPLFGLGLVDAVPDDALVDLAAAQAAADPAVAGRPGRVIDLATGRTVVGKLGWKAQVPSLAQFAADAYLNEMGVTSPLFPRENCPQGDCVLLRCDPAPDPEDDGEDVSALTDFMTLLAPPPSPVLSDRALAGRRTFDEIGCAFCHVPRLRTGTSPIAALDRRGFSPYSDLLLHDMGALGDGIAQGSATPREMRTAPLWGLGARSRFLHDGRATTIGQAILAHDGQARRARDRYRALGTAAAGDLLSFLRSL